MSEPDVTRRRVVQALAVGSAAVAPAARAQTASGRPAYRDPSLPTERRVADLLARMTLEEKVAQMVGIGEEKKKVNDAQGRFDAVRAAALFPHGLGHFSSPSETTVGIPGEVDNFTPAQTAVYVNALQRWAVEGTRLGIPVLTHEESLHGLRARSATSFPQAIGLASTFDPGLVERCYAVAAAETRVRNSRLVLTPVVDVARDPRWGRTEETFGEDPHLCSVMGAAAIRGFQGAVSAGATKLAPDRVFSCVKHFAAHGASENGTNIGPVNVGERTLRDELLPPYEYAVRSGGARVVMVTYNEIDGVPCIINGPLINGVLRGEWGFKGLVIADYKAIKELISQHHAAADLDECAVLALTAGVDVELPDPAAYPRLPALVRTGRVDPALIDAAVRRVLTIKFDAGLFEQPYVPVEAADAATGTPANRVLAREAAQRAMVLLKNARGTLPLHPDRVGRLAVIGPSATDTPIGEYSDVPRHVVSLMEAMQAEAAGGRFKLEYAQGVGLTESRSWTSNDVVPIAPEENRRRIAAAVELARRSDTVILVLGDNEQIAREAWSVEHQGDRDTLDLFGQQNELASAIFALGKPTIVVLINGRPPSVPLVAERADALIEGWYLGQETGGALVDVLFGRANPGGKLPVSLARSVGQLPVYYYRKPTARRDYLLSTPEPLFPFGFGLSYTTFDLSAPRLARATVRRGEAVDVEVDVANTGPVAGDEVVQVYVHDLVASVTRPIRLLKAFERVTLKPGERRTVRLRLTPDDLALWNREMKRVVEPGGFDILAGPDSRTLKSARLTVTA